MSFNKRMFNMYNAPHEAGVNKIAYLTDIKLKKLGFKDSSRDFPFYKRKESNRSLKKFLERIGLL